MAAQKLYGNVRQLIKDCKISIKITSPVTKIKHLKFIQRYPHTKPTKAVTRIIMQTLTFSSVRS